MAKYININVALTNDSIGDVNALLNPSYVGSTPTPDPTKTFEGIQNIINMLEGLEAGTKAGTVVAVTSTAATSVSGASGGISAIWSFA
jgi:hypothetical protein